MSAVEDLRNKSIRLRDELKTVQGKLHQALLDAEPLKVGDWVKIDTYKGPVYGKVRGFVFNNDELRIDVAPPTPNPIPIEGEKGHDKEA